MKRFVLIAVATGALASMMFAQATGATQSPSTTSSQTPAEAQGAPSSTPATGASAHGAIAAGTSINAELSKGIDSKKAKENDPVQAKVVQDVVVGGKVIAPRNSKLVGHVTQAKAGGKGEASSLGVAFDKIVLKNGQELPFHAVVQALAPAPHMPAGAAAYPSGGDDMPSPSTGGGGYNTTGGGGGMATPTGGTMPAAGSVGGPTPTNQTAANGGANTPSGNAPGMTSAGQLNASSRGVMGMPGVTLDSSSNNASVLTNEKRNVKLDSGTQMVLRVTAQ